MFGRYFDKVCQRLHMTWDQVAKESGLDPSTISKAMRQGKNNPQYETVEKIVSVFMKQKGWLYKYKIGLFNLTHYATPEQYEEAVHDLIYMEYVDEHYGPDYIERQRQQDQEPPK